MEDGGDKIKKKLVAYGIGRFQVMALLQAARYYIVHGDLDKAKSFGLNRAIFYAWAKYYGPHTLHWKQTRLEDILRKRVVKQKKGKCPNGMKEILGECVEVSPRGYYVIGGKEQSPKDFYESVEKKLSRLLDPRQAWEATLEYVKKFPKWILEDQQKFYKIVYEPIRDSFFIELALGRKPEPPKWLMEKIESVDKMIKKIGKQKTLFDYK